MRMYENVVVDGINEEGERVFCTCPKKWCDVVVCCGRGAAVKYCRRPKLCLALMEN
jgi:hypothetical protein